MPVVNRINAFAEDMTAWRRHLHSIPELDLECHETAAFVAERLREFGVDELPVPLVNMRPALTAGNA